MKKTSLLMVVLLALVSTVVTQNAGAAEEAWKGKPDSSDFSLGFLSGLGIIDATGGFTLAGTVSRKIMEPGFAPDINNAVSIELQLGPLFASGGTALFYSTHLRWDFRKDPAFGLYAIGGLGGFSSGSALGNHFELFPRFGVGAMWYLQQGFVLRGEVSHELIGVGILFPL